MQSVPPPVQITGLGSSRCTLEVRGLTAVRARSPGQRGPYRAHSAKTGDSLPERRLFRDCIGDDGEVEGDGVVGDEREVALELDDARQFATVLIGAADRGGGSLVHGEHAGSGWAVDGRKGRRAGTAAGRC